MIDARFGNIQSAIFVEAALIDRHQRPGGIHGYGIFDNGLVERRIACGNDQFIILIGQRLEILCRDGYLPFAIRAHPGGVVAVAEGNFHQSALRKIARSARNDERLILLLSVNHIVARHHIHCQTGLIRLAGDNGDGSAGARRIARRIGHQRANHLRAICDIRQIGSRHIHAPGTVRLDLGTVFHAIQRQHDHAPGFHEGGRTGERDEALRLNGIDVVIAGNRVQRHCRRG